MTAETNNQKFTAFVQAVGTDIKELQNQKANKTELTEKFDQLNQVVQGLQSRAEGVTEQVVIEKITALKNELLGGEGLDETLDTVKELGDKLKEMRDDQTISGAITAKLTELKEQIDAVKDALRIDDLVQVYNTAKL